MLLVQLCDALQNVTAVLAVNISEIAAVAVLVAETLHVTISVAADVVLEEDINVVVIGVCDAGILGVNVTVPVVLYEIELDVSGEGSMLPVGVALNVALTAVVSDSDIEADREAEDDPVPLLEGVLEELATCDDVILPVCEGVVVEVDIMLLEPISE